MKKPIKILVISNYQKLRVARPEAEIMISLHQQEGFEVDIMTYGDAEYIPRFEKMGMKVIPFHPEKKMDKKEIAYIRSVLEEGNYDILQLFNGKAIVNGIQAAKDLPVKIVLYRGYSANIAWYDPFMYVKFLHPRVDKIICNSIGVQELFQRQLFFPKHKAVAVNKGHKIEWYNGVEALDIRKELGIEEDTFVAVCVANNRRMKGIPYLLKAMQYLADSPIHLALIGNGFDTPANQKLIQKSPIASQIHLVGYRKDALSLVKGSDAFVLSSIKGESITKAVLEAMSLGIAPLITDIAGNKELVNHKENGLVVPSKNPKALAEGLIYLQSHPEECQAFGKKSRERIETVINHENAVAGYKKVYEELVGG